MAQKQNLQELLDKPMDRKQFLGHIGAGLLVLVGVSGLIGHLINHGQEAADDSGYGDTPYGGDKQS